MRTHLPSFSSTKERIKSRIQHTSQPIENKALSRAPAGDEFDESTADLTSNATLSYQFPPTPQSASKPKVRGIAERPERADCQQSVVSDVTWQEQELANVSGRSRNSLSSNPYISHPLPHPPSTSTSTSPYHQHSADSPRPDYAPKNLVQNYGNDSATNAKPQVTRPQHRQRKRASVSSVVSELTWNEPLPQEPSLLNEKGGSSSHQQVLGLTSQPPKTTSVLGKLEAPEGKSSVAADHRAPKARDGYRYKKTTQKEPQRQLSYDDSVSSLVSDITWMDLDNSTVGRPSFSNTNELFNAAHAYTPDSRSRSPARSSANNVELSSDTRTSSSRQRSSFHDSTVSELSWMNSESSLKISDLMRTSIMEVVNEGSGTPSTSDGSKEINEAIGVTSGWPAKEEASPENKMKMRLIETTQMNLDDLVRLEDDTLPTIPRRKNSASSFDLLGFSDDSDYLEESDEPSEPKKVSKSKKVYKKSMETKAMGGKTLPRESEHSVESVSKKKGTKTKAGGGVKSKNKKLKKKIKKTLDESEHSNDGILDHKPRKTKAKGKKKKPKDSDRAKLDDSEHGTQLHNGETLKKPSKKSKKKKLDDSERSAGTDDTVATLKARIKKKLDDSDRSVFGESDRSTFEVGELPDLKTIGVLKKRDDLDTSNHSVQSAVEFGSSRQKVLGNRSRRSRNSDLDSSNHSIQSCLEMETTRFSSPKPSALSDKPIRPSFRPKVSVKKTKRKSVTFADGEPSRPLVPIPRKEMTRDWGEEGSVDSLPSMSQRNISSQSPPSLPARRVSKGTIDSNDIKPVSKPPKNVHQSPSSRVGGVDFLLNRISGIDQDSDSEVPRNNDVAPRMPRPRLSQDSPQFLSPTVIKGCRTPATPVLSTPKVSARDQLGLTRVEQSASKLVTPTGKILGKQRKEKRRTESSMRKVEVFESMHSIMIDELPDEE
ncbi:unnamed protein product [Cylindrotheca closterium]|uniref:Uncharacterized protein n=1 Tax=Cylindrotheca closterium TaxID=2856 RepID=A0AAD2PVY8_9STRA|nr:unnamed protein product [Cylindrotheca closterium]